MKKIDRLYEAADDFGLVTSAQARALGTSNAELVQYAARGKLERMTRGVYRIPAWPYQEALPYAVAVRATGEGTYLYGESVIALLKLAPTNPNRIWVANPRRVRKHFGERFNIIGSRKNEKTAFYAGIFCQHVSGAIEASRTVIGDERANDAAVEAFRLGYITEDEKNELIGRKIS